MLRIGNVTLVTNLLLAPIARYCDLAFRTVCRESSFLDGADGGLGLACTDLLSPQGLLRGSQTSLDLARTNGFDKPIGMQIYGSDPAVMAEGGRWAQDHGATIVDINMGCPVDKVTKKDGGSKLMCDLDRAVRIAQAVAEAITVPLTCKMRLGWCLADKQRNVAGELACRLIDVGARAITVHGRTAEERFTGSADRSGIRRVVEAVRARHGRSVPVIGNGDVSSPSDCAEMIAQTGCDGVMIGRGALSAPWIFRDCWAHLRGLPIPPEPSDEQKLAIVLRFFDLMLEHKSEPEAMHQVRTRIAWFGKRINGGHCKPLKEAIRTARDPAEVRAALLGWQNRAADADSSAEDEPLARRAGEAGCSV